MLTATWRPERADLHMWTVAQGAVFPALFVEECLGMSICANTCVTRCTFLSPSRTYHLFPGTWLLGSMLRGHQIRQTRTRPLAWSSGLSQLRLSCSSLSTFCVPSLHQSGKYLKKEWDRACEKQWQRTNGGINVTPPWYSLERHCCFIGSIWLPEGGCSFRLVLASCGRRRQLIFHDGWISFADWTPCLLPSEKDHWLFTSYLKIETTF